MLLETHEIYSHEFTVCQQALGAVAWDSPGRKRVSEHLRCGACDSDLIKPLDPSRAVSDLVFRCSSCEKESRFEELPLEQAVKHCWFSDMYIAMTDGGDDPIEDCEECGKFTFVVEDGRCLACSEGLHYFECAVCHQALGPAEQQFGGLCGYHYSGAHKDE